jgi:hypothetical protein
VRFQAKVLIGQAIVFTIAAVIYIAGGGSIAGFVMLAAAVIFGVWTAIFLLRRRYAIDEGTSSSVVGRFPVGTTRAPLLAAATVLLANGLVVGWWLVAIAGLILVVVAGLYFFEYTERSVEKKHVRKRAALIVHSLSEVQMDENDGG